MRPLEPYRNIHPLKDLKKMYSQILLPMDGSSLAEQALPHAVALAGSFQVELILLKVLVPLANNLCLPIGALKKAEAATRELAHEYLDQIATRVQATFPITTVTLEGQPYGKIIHFAENEQVDLIVMCTRGHSGISRWLMGSVSDCIVRGARTPLLLIRPEEDHGR
jgi:nucleotide-binding universal stress UspA family protein